MLPEVRATRPAMTLEHITILALLVALLLALRPTWRDRRVPPSLRQRIYRFLYDRVPESCETPRHHAVAFRDYRRRELVTVIWPLHWPAQLGWWLFWRWEAYRHGRSFLDRLIAARAETLTASSPLKRR